MSKRGPPPTPTDILKLRGSHRGNERPNEPRPRKAAPVCPRCLPKEAKAVWKHLVPMLQETKILTVADGGALERYCCLFVRWRAMVKWLEENGEVQETDKGYRQQQPEVSIASNLAKELGRLEAEFGLTPAARTRIQVESKPEVAPVRKRERRA